jgi:hypothetical protein
MIARGIHAPRFGWAVAGVVLVATATSCTRVPLTAPTKSVIALYASASSSGDGTVTLIATVTEEAGTPVQNGTLVTFTTTIGRLDPTSARTTNGQATVKFFADGQSGTATVSAFSGGATAAGTGAVAATVTIPLGGATAADTIAVHAEPSSLPAGGGTTTVIAQVRDQSGTALSNVPVSFSTTAGTLQPPSVATDSSGAATTNLTTTTTAAVTAAAGVASATVDVPVAALPAITLSASPSSPVVGQSVTFAIGLGTANAANPIQNVRIDFGDGNFRDLGAVTGSTTAAHIYTSVGNRTVTVTVTDTANQQATQTLALVVTPSAAATRSSGVEIALA